MQSNHKHLTNHLILVKLPSIQNYTNLLIFLIFMSIESLFINFLIIPNFSPLLIRSMRNPFTSVTNISFTRNNSRFSQQTKETYTARSLSNHKYFDYKSSYMHDSYLQNYENRKQQENRFCKVMGLEAMRYRPDPPPFIDNEYYTMESACSPIYYEAEFKP